MAIALIRAVHATRAGVRVEPAEAAVVAEMFEWYQREHQSLVGLTKHLISQKIPTPRGKLRWNQATVRGILRNPVYTGTVFLGRYRVARAQYRQSALRPVGHDHGGHPATGPHEWEAVAQIPAIVTQEQFDLVQSKFAQNQQYARRNNTAHPYEARWPWSVVGPVICRVQVGIEAQRLESMPTTRGLGKGHPVVSCRDEKCRSRFMPAGQLDELVWKDRMSKCSPILRRLQRRCIERKEGSGCLRSCRLVGRMCGIRACELDAANGTTD